MNEKKKHNNNNPNKRDQRERKCVCVLENLIRRERDKQILSKTQIRVRVLNFYPNFRPNSNLSSILPSCYQLVFFFHPNIIFLFHTPLSTNLQHGIQRFNITIRMKGNHHRNTFVQYVHIQLVCPCVDILPFQNVNFPRM